MHILVDLAARELYFLVVLVALGIGPAAYLSERFDLPARLAMAPVLGFALGCCVFTTTLQYFPAQDTYWLLPVVAVISAAAGIRQLRRGPERGRSGFNANAVVQLLVVCAVVMLPTTLVLTQRDTVGPAAYMFTDMNNYVAEQDAAQTTSVGDASDLWKKAKAGTRFEDLTRYNFAALSDAGGNLDAAPLAAQANALIGLGASDTISAYLIVLMLMGALGAFAAVRYATQSSTWAAVLAAALFGGPFFLELWFDGFQAALCALALQLPMIMIGAEVLRTRRRADMVLMALVFGSLFIIYPLFVPLIVILAAFVLAYLGIARRRRGEPIAPTVGPVVRGAVFIGVLAVVFNHAAFLRCVHYAGRILRDEVPYPRVSFKLPVDVLPGWLFQVREFWFMPGLADGGFKQFVLGGLIPLALLAVILYGFRRYRAGLVLVVFAVICAVIAQYSYMSQDNCTYCAERNLLPLAVVIAALLGIGVWALTTAPQRWLRVVGVIAAALTIVAVGQRARISLERFSNGSYFLDAGNRDALDRLPDDGRPVQLEGYSAQGQPETPFVYHLVNEEAPDRVSVSVAANDNNSLAYLTFSNVLRPGPEFKSDYGYVLTRFGGIDSGRRTITSDDGIALERRTRALDVTPYSGLGSPLQRFNPGGQAFVQPQLGPLKFHVVGRTRGRVSVRLTLRSNVALEVPKQRGVRSRLQGAVTTVCVPATGRAPIRDAQVRLAPATLTPPPVPDELFPVPGPPRNIELTAMRATTGRCTP